MLSTEFRIESILPGYLGLPKNLKAGIAMAMTDPLILPTERDADWLPDWMIPAIKAERVKCVLDGGLKETTSDLEIVAYLMCASFDGPLADDVVHLYFNVIGRALPEAFVRSAKENGIPIEPLDESQERFAKDTKRRMSRDKKNQRKKGKWKTTMRLLEGVSMELGTFDLLVKEGRV